MSDLKHKTGFFNLKSTGNSKLQDRTEKPSSAPKIWCMVLQKPPLAKSPIDKKFAQSPWHEFLVSNIFYFPFHIRDVILPNWRTPSFFKMGIAPPSRLNTISWFLSHEIPVSHDFPMKHFDWMHWILTFFWFSCRRSMIPTTAMAEPKGSWRPLGMSKNRWNSEFGGMNIHKSKLFWCEQKGTRVPWPIDQTWSNMIKVYVSSPVEASDFLCNVYGNPWWLVVFSAVIFQREK